MAKARWETATGIILIIVGFFKLQTCRQETLTVFPQRKLSQCLIPSTDDDGIVGSVNRFNDFSIKLYT